MKLHLRSLSIVWWVLLTLVCHRALAQESFIIVTGADSNPPFSGPDLPGGGLVTQIIQEALGRMGAESDVEYLPWNQAYRRAESAQVLGTFPYVKDQERLALFYFSTPLYVTVERFFVAANASIRFESDNDIQDKILCRPLGYSHESIQRFLDTKRVKLWEPNDLATCFQILAAGRVDLVPIGEETGRTLIRQMYGNDALFDVLPKPIQVNGYHLMASKNYPNVLDVLQRFDAQIQVMWKEGRIQELYRLHNTALPAAEMFLLAP